MCKIPQICITNRHLVTGDCLEQFRYVAGLHPEKIILREKDLPQEQYEILAEKVLKVCYQEKVSCVLHYYPEAAKKLGVRAIHLPMPLLRSLDDRDKEYFDEIGASTHSVEEAVEAQTGKTGEKHVLCYYAIVEAPFVASYIHTLNGKIGAIVGFNKEIPADLAKGVVMQVASMNPVAISAADCSKEVVDNELAVAVQKTREEMVLKAVEAALKKAGINPAHVDSEEHIESNTAKGWITPEQAEQAREIIRTVSAEKAANLNEQMIQNIANGRLQKFFKEQTLEEQEYQMSDDHISVKAAIQAADKDAKVVAFKRFSLAD